MKKWVLNAEVALHSAYCTNLIYYYPSAKPQCHVAWNYPTSSQIDGYVYKVAFHL